MLHRKTGFAQCWQDVQGSLFQLREIKVMGSPGSDPLLDLSGQATICYVVQDEVVTSNTKWGDVPKLSLQIQDVFQEDKAASHASHGQVVPAACDHQWRYSYLPGS